MNQSIYDNQTFFDGYKALRDRDDNYNVLLEQPAMAERLPDLTGKRVLDLGCGYGCNCLDFVRRGAERVVGVDLSVKMLEEARRHASHPKIEYRRMDMADLSGLDETFDLIYSSLAVHYVEDFVRLAKECYRLLAGGGQLLFSQEHPIITATMDGRGHFNFDESGNQVSYTFSDYGRSGRREIEWFVDGVVKYHRTFGEIITALARAGLVVEEVNEPLPKAWAIEKLPSIAKEYIKTNFMLVKAVRPEE